MKIQLFICKISKILKHLSETILTTFNYVKFHRKFQEYHFSDRISNGVRINPKYIKLGHGVSIGPNGRIEGVSRYNNRIFNPQIILQDQVSIQQNVHLTCANKIFIGKNTAIAANVTITDINHPYTEINIPVEYQDIEVSEVIIGADGKIYNGVVILPGTHIGKHCVIGANSVVTHDIPDYSVAVGVPAKVIKKYNHISKKWEKQI